MSSLSRRLSLTLLFGFFLLLYFTPSSVHAAACTNTFTSSVPVTTGYGAAYNLFSTGKELLLQGTDCTASSYTIILGSGTATQYIYNKSHSWNGTNWTPLNLTSSSPLISNAWYTGQATASVTPTNNAAYVVAYICQQVNSAWKCGCKDTACTAPAWQLQSISMGGSAAQCGNSVCEAGETTQSCAKDCPASQAGERGRVHVANNIVLTDRNTPLRGATIGILSDAGKSGDPNYWKYLHDMGINAVRLGVKLSQAGRTITQQLPLIDRAVDLAGQNHMYVMIGNSVQPGSYNLQELKTFWSAVAPRYKNRTHVFYEMTNEPVGWWPRSYTAQNIADLKSVYDIMRSGAPDTHIVLFDFPNLVPDSSESIIAKIGSMQGIDYAKASVAFHHYVDKTNAIEQTIIEVRKRYPLLMTETNYWIDDPPSHATDVNTLRLEEKLGIGWFSLDGKGSATHLENEIIPNLHTAGYNWAIEN